MKKTSKILMFLFFIGLAYLAWSIFVFTPQIESLRSSLAISGESMEPTFHNGDIVRYLPGLTPKIGSIVSFECLVDKCLHQTVAHRITAIEPNGCMHIEGDNQPISWDTRDYGCLMPNEIVINGVVIDK